MFQLTINSLLPENKLYFDEIRDYMILKSFLKDEQAILDQIYGMASDLKMAEADGLTAKDFFGTEAKVMADQLLKNAPKVPLKEIATTYFGAVASLYAIGILLLFANTGRFQLEFILFLASCVNALLIYWLIFGLLPSLLFKPKPPKVVLGVITLTMIILFNIVSSLPTMIGDIGMYLRFPEIVDWLFVIVTSLVTLIFSIKAKAFRVFALLIFAFLINGILKKLIVIGIVSGQLWSVWLPIGTLIIALLIFYLISYRLVKEADKG
ncbi:membrane protein [Streptococcus agalactiae LMG 14747]|uniref:Membrane protein n=1 Tax=Streptococcus agalactiae LMG 14747 TaxID=1154860 RepID=V6Z4H8_STRAG|nr:membrane protein [Streptococcus agalactiae LMG 14747]